MGTLVRNGLTIFTLSKCFPIPELLLIKVHSQCNLLEGNMANFFLHILSLLSQIQNLVSDRLSIIFITGK